MKRDTEAWITREWFDASGKRKRKQCNKPGVTGIRSTDRFVVEWLEPKSRKRRREKVPGFGPEAKRLADERRKELNAQFHARTYQEASDVSAAASAKLQAEQKASWEYIRAEYIRIELPRKRSDETRKVIRAALATFQAITQPQSVCDITTKTIDDYVAVRLKDKTRGGGTIRATTINKELRSLKSFFHTVADWETIPGFRPPKIDMLDEIETEGPSYTESEFFRIFENVDAATLPHVLTPAHRRAWWRALLAVFWETGMRRGEALSLEWSHVDFARRLFIINPQNTKGKRAKTIPFNEWVEGQLRALAAYHSDGRVFPFPHDQSRLNANLARIQKKAGVAVRSNLKFHAIRRTTGNTIAEQYGLDAAQQKLCHANPSVTKKHYAQAAMRSLAAKAQMPIPQQMQAGQEGVQTNQANQSPASASAIEAVIEAQPEKHPERVTCEKGGIDGSPCGK